MNNRGLTSSSAKRFGLVVVLALVALVAGNHGIGFAQGGKTITVCASGCDFVQIQAAVNAASTGDTIEVQAGTYKENVTIQERQGLTLQGAGSDQVTLDGSAGVSDQKPAIFIEQSQNITVEGFKIVGSRRGVHAIESTGLVLKSSRFESNLRQSILLDRSQVELSDLFVTKTKVDQDGTHGEGGNFSESRVTIKNSTLSGNFYLGIMFYGEQNPTLTIENSVISDNGDTGIWTLQKAKLTVQNSTINNNGFRGVDAIDNSTVTIRQTTISNNHEIGVVSRGNAQVSLDNVQILGSKNTGVWAVEAGRVMVQNSTITNSGYRGIDVSSEAMATVLNSTISDNQDAGIYVRDKAQAEISNNTIQNNRACGVSSGIGGSIKITGQGNTISGNTKGQLCGATGKFPKGFGGGK